MADIAAVAEYARRFGVRVYVTLNTLLFDDELADAERIARQVVEAGADALIVQDMAYLEMELEGVELHASTQTFNASPEKAAFLADCGFSRVILERNLSLEEIRRIRFRARGDMRVLQRAVLHEPYHVAAQRKPGRLYAGLQVALRPAGCRR